uniref:Uncharacterized protein n=1 Tax=Devosia nanyangense TaxID=1228055 RepID=A0A933L4U6_9HYPH|nr:hypothetical protein [Devosia nanyangense]
MSERQHRGIKSTALSAEGPMRDLGRELGHHRARAGRAWRRYASLSEKVDPAATRAHQVWSDAIDDALRTAEAISQEQPRSLNDLLVQYEAIWWWVGEDDNVLDGSTRRWLTRFRHSLRRLASQRISSDHAVGGGTSGS